MELLGHGRTAEVYRTDDGKAVKLYRVGMSENIIAYEARIAKAIGSVCSVAPDFYGITSIEGRKGLLYQLVDGNALTEMTHKEKIDISGLARRMAEVHRCIHALSADDLPTMMDTFVPRLKAYNRLSNAGLQNLIAFIKRDETKRICHGDLHVENVIEDSSGKLWAIDWTNAYSGNPDSDLARSLYLFLHGLPPGQDQIELAEQLFREQAVESFIEFYGGDDPRNSEDWDVWQLLILISRCSEGIDPERPKIDQMISGILDSRPEFA